ncbi:glycosyltransferase [Chelatococcus albus]
MRAVFVHRHFPGQFGHLLHRLAAEGWETTFVCEHAEKHPPHVRLVRYMTGRRQAGASHRHLVMPEQHLRTGEQVAAVLDNLRQREGAPAIVVGHIGWGGLLFAKDVLPRTPMLGYCEFYYRAEGSDVGFDPAESVSLDTRMRLRMRNTAQILTMEAIEAGVSPTRWQRHQYPADIRRRIAVCHDGIDTSRCRPLPGVRLALPDGRMVAQGDPVVTFVARDLEPYRGFPQFMRAAARVARRHPQALFLVAGGDGVSYGRHREDGRTWREALTRETGLPPERIAFLGRIPHDALIRLFQISAAHVYLTYPFVLSWSFLEAMACGCLVIGSATPPVREVLTHGRNGLLVDFFDEEAIAAAILEALTRGDALSSLRAGARATVLRDYNLEQCLTRQLGLIDLLTGQRHAHRAAAG